MLPSGVLGEQRRDVVERAFLSSLPVGLAVVGEPEEQSASGAAGEVVPEPEKESTVELYREDRRKVRHAEDEPVEAK